jgi:hypothetical protein
MNTSTLYTLGGALYWVMIRYNILEMSGGDWQILCSHLKISDTTVHSVQPDDTGFLFESKSISFTYTHNDFHGERNIEFF